VGGWGESGYQVPGSLGELLDEVCVQIFAEQDRGGEARSLRASPEVYEAITRAHRQEIERGNPPMILDLDLVLDVVLEGWRAVVY
jgi:uncharacterized membrane-anchored protein